VAWRNVRGPGAHYFVYSGAWRPFYFLDFRGPGAHHFENSGAWRPLFPTSVGLAHVICYIRRPGPLFRVFGGLVTQFLIFGALSPTISCIRDHNRGPCAHYLLYSGALRVSGALRSLFPVFGGLARIILCIRGPIAINI